MWFKNLYFFAFTRPFECSEEDLEKNLEAALIYDNIGYAAECESCQTACDLLEYLNILVNDVCNCK